MVTDGLTLALDAAASTGTIAVLRDGALAAERTVEMRSNAEERFFPAILEALEEAGATTRDLARVVCGAGPGGFTSLRVVGAMAKGIAVGSDKPLFGVPSLALIVAASPDTVAPGSRWLASLDALRGERYLALVEVGTGGALRSVTSLGLADVSTLAARATALDAQLIGPDESVRAEPHARGLVRCLDLLQGTPEADVASWEPAYGRLAEAQVKWEATHGRALGVERSRS